MSRATGFQPVTCGQPLSIRTRPGGARPALRDGTGHSTHVQCATVAPAGYRRRGTALIFTLAILSLLALIGFAVLGTVRTERVRWLSVRSARARPNIMNQVVQTVRERLYADLWQADASTANGYLSDEGSLMTPPVFPFDEREQNEPFDAPGRFDRWLASTLPYLYRGALGNTPTAVQTGILTVAEETVVWPRVSYLGVEFLRGGSPPNVPYWAVNSRTGQPFAFPIYRDDGMGTSSLGGYKIDPAGINGVPVILVPPDFSPANMLFYSVTGDVNTNTPIAGSTTNVTIAEARRIWESPNPTGQGRGAAVAAGVLYPRFPYFDTNMDGELDLYDADGDGIPDSPLSFAIPYPATRPEDPKEVYAAIRIIDNSSMINLNTVSPVVPPDSRPARADALAAGYFGALTFDEQPHPAGPYFYNDGRDFQRRGRYPSDVVLDELWAHGPVGPGGVRQAPVHTNDELRVTNALSRQYGGLLGEWFNPAEASRLYARRPLIGGVVDPATVFFNPYSVIDETTLRNRFLIPPSSGAGFNKNANAADYSTVERALRNTMYWDRGWNWGGLPVPPGDYVDFGGSGWRVDKFDTALNVDGGATVLAPSAADLAVLTLASGVKSWKTLVDELSPWFIRRPLFTTVSYSSTRRPNTAKWTPPPPIGGAAPFQLVLPGRAAQLITAVPAPLERVQLNPMWWNAVSVPPQPRDPDFASMPPAATPETLLWLTHLVYAIYNGLETDSKIDDGVMGTLDTSGAMGSPALDPTDPSPYVTSQERTRIAWQLAVNILDYCDADNEPTIVIDPTALPAPGIRYVGQERQPFISKVGRRVTYDAMGNEDPAEAIFAVELINPYPDTFGSVPQQYVIKVLNQMGTVVQGPFNVTMAIPAATAMNPGRYLITNDQVETTEPMAANAVEDEIATFEFDENDTIVLYRQINNVSAFAVNPVEWPVDSFRVDHNINTVGGMPGNSDLYVFRRDERDWKFTTDDFEEDEDLGQVGTPSLDMTPPATPPNTSAESSQIVVRNQGFTRSLGVPLITYVVRNFDSPADLSRLMAAGTYPTALVDANPPWADTIQQTLPRRMAESLLGTNAREKPALCRLNFTVDDKDVRGIFNQLTTLSLGMDNTDNDGDGTIDESDEAQQLNLRLAGTINVNTAPAMVLRTAPYTSRQPSAPSLPPSGWDVAAGIVAFREKRPVPSPALGWSPTIAPPNSVASAGTATSPEFKSVGDLLRLDSTAANDPFSAIRFGHDGVDLIAHDAATPATWWSPDYDAEPTADDASPSPSNDIREQDILLSRWANVLTTRSDVYTVYIALIDENGRYLQRSQFTLDRSVCAVEDLPSTPLSAKPILPQVLGRVDTDYADDTR